MRNQVSHPSILENLSHYQILSRLDLLEAKVFKTRKSGDPSEAQRFLIFFHLGFIDTLRVLPIQQKQKDEIISRMLGIDQDNARKFFSESTKKERPLLKSVANYSFLSAHFHAVGMTDKAKECEKILLQIQNLQDRKAVS